MLFRFSFFLFPFSLLMNDPLINRPSTGGGIIVIGGSVNAEGTNYIFTGSAPNQVLRIKNTDTGLANRIDTVGVDGVQSVSLENGV
jgi:hypothetical protein